LENFPRRYSALGRQGVQGYNSVPGGGSIFCRRRLREFHSRRLVGRLVQNGRIVAAREINVEIHTFTSLLCYLTVPRLAVREAGRNAVFIKAVSLEKWQKYLVYALALGLYHTAQNVAGLVLARLYVHFNRYAVEFARDAVAFGCCRRCRHNSTSNAAARLAAGLGAFVFF